MMLLLLLLLLGHITVVNIVVAIMGLVLLLTTGVGFRLLSVRPRML
jgi:hypothetical protein